MDPTQVISISEKVSAATAAVLTAQQVGSTVQASGGDKMQAALAMAGALSPALPPQAQGTVMLLQLVYNMFKTFKHPSFTPSAAPVAQEASKG